MADPPLYFYLPSTLWLDDFPTDPEENWPGFGLGVYAWTVQTYLHLRRLGVPCTLGHQMPEAGIVLLHRNVLWGGAKEVYPTARRLVVCLQGDRPPHPHVPVQIVQNPIAAAPHQGRYFMPHWPQPGLLPRDDNRGDRFATVAFFGHTANLAPEFNQPEWLAALARLGLTWQTVVNTNRWNDYRAVDNRWNDYRSVDAVVAVRSFAPRERRRTRDYGDKPATKLYNAWLAGVPAILGVESAYRAERRSPLDYVEAAALTDVIQALEQLQADPVLRLAMIDQGRQRALAVTPAAIAQRWQQLIEQTLLPLYDDWCQQPPWQQALTRQRHWRTCLRRRGGDRWRQWRYRSRRP